MEGKDINHNPRNWKRAKELNLLFSKVRTQGL
jgi:hypothetical protein